MRLHLDQKPLDVRALPSLPSEGEPESPHRPSQPQRVETARDCRIAAAVLGEQARRVLGLLQLLRSHDLPALSIDADVYASVGLGLARQAASYAVRALALEDVEFGTMGNVRR